MLHLVDWPKLARFILGMLTAVLGFDNADVQSIVNSQQTNLIGNPYVGTCPNGANVGTVTAAAKQRSPNFKAIATYNDSVLLAYPLFHCPFV